MTIVSSRTNFFSAEKHEAFKRKQKINGLPFTYFTIPIRRDFPESSSIVDGIFDKLKAGLITPQETRARLNSLLKRLQNQRKASANNQG